MPNKRRFRQTLTVPPVKVSLDNDTNVAHLGDIGTSRAQPGAFLRPLLLITLGLLLLSHARSVSAQEMTRLNVNVMQQANSVILNRPNSNGQIIIRGESSIRDIVPVIRQDEPPRELSLGEIARQIRAERKRREQATLPWPAE
jgi:hypothetical protein